ncbi:gephyrin-like molybdotransferase receptor GlpR [Corynebacterium lowii]|uniref:divisome protein SepX/GlpR n=1 Tax=Corynebacterium lowii TaxID=1544413 RepID=UPI0006DCEF95|nr:gephyrin-like molybdotransferase receptor GlpR [Corynebacterium lowii]MDP9850564.1 heme exporter protein D [Corynebacterium lowii]
MSSGGLLILLIIVLWLFVLIPLLQRNNKPIRKTGEALEETRVVYEGGSTLSGGMRRKPKIKAEDIHYSEEKPAEEYEVVASEEVSTERAEPLEEEIPEVYLEGDVVHELEAAENDAQDDSEEAVEAEEAVEGDTYEVDETHTTPEDLLYPSAAEDSQEPVEEGADEEHAEDSEEELSEEELEFAASRRGRGGWDPETDAANSADRYQRRQRTLMGLGGVTALAVILAVIFGGWVWVAPGIAALLLLVYLLALRAQVRQEEALRRRRIRQLRRARMGVRHRDDEALKIPRQLLRPGAVVLEMDDESPDFHHLEVRSVPRAEGVRREETYEHRAAV